MKNKNLKVTIIIPAYNVEKYIHRALDSSLHQTYDNVEVVVVDDGSTDLTWDVLTEYRKKSDKLKIYKQENAGVSVARNAAIRRASGELIIFLDSDDWIELNTVEKLVEIFQENNECLICVDRYFCYLDNGGILREQQNINLKSNKLNISDSVECISNHMYNLQSACYKIYRSDLIKKYNLKFNENIYHGEDGLFVFEYLINTQGLIYENLPLWNILDRPGSATNSQFNKKWLSAIEGGKIMLNNTCLTPKQKKNIRIYLVERITMVKQSAKLHGVNKTLMKDINKELYEHIFFYMFSSVSIKRKVFLLILFLPSRILQKLFK